jgi:hypothetical protein
MVAATEKPPVMRARMSSDVAKERVDKAPPGVSDQLLERVVTAHQIGHVLGNRSVGHARESESQRPP